MESDKYIGDYLDKDLFYRCKVVLYNVLFLRICREVTKLVTFTPAIKTVNDLRKFLVFSELEKFGEGKLKDDKDFKH